ncbi:MAG: archaellin/type IV pilin N-terminal domain-containing protein [Candidatus Hydrothermarchaeales archaeon]
MGRSLIRFLKEDRGQVGVGSLIIFIAVILVAAISAGVLLRASGVLSVRATSTAESATREVSTKIDVFQVTGYSNESAPRENITEIFISSRLSPGSPSIALEDIMLIFQAGDIYVSGISTSGTGEQVFTYDFTKNTTADSTLEEGESVDIKYSRGGNMKMSKGTTFFFTIQPQGVITRVKKTVPNSIAYAYSVEWG